MSLLAGSQEKTKTENLTNEESVANVHESENEEERKISATVGTMVEGVYVRPKGLHWFITVLFLLGELAGGGMVTLPIAVVQSNIYVCVILVGFMTISMTYTAHLLGNCWLILLDRWPEYRIHCRKPYPEIAFRAIGPKFRTLVSACVNITQFGTAVIYLLLSAKNIDDLILMYTGNKFSYCYVILIVAVCMLPVTFLKSPQDFWGIMLVGMFTSAIAASLIVVGGYLDFDTCSKEMKMPEFTITNYFMAIGTFLFAYGGHVAFPTIQHDMKTPAEFSKSATVAFVLLSIIYLPVGSVGYFTYGNSLKHSIISSLQTMWIQQTVNICITVHVILTLTIMFNPLHQEMEEFFKLPHSFGWKRVVLRTGMMLLVVFVAVTVPTFGPLLDLVGGSTQTATSLIFPNLFFLRLNAAKDDKGNFVDCDEMDWVETFRKTNKWTIVFTVSVSLIGFLFGLSATISAVRALISTHFVPPCYVQPFLSYVEGDNKTIGAVDCCGAFQNVTKSDNIHCSAPIFNFYD